MSHISSFEQIGSPESNRNILEAEEGRLFERLRERGKKLAGILAFTTAFAVMVEGGVFAHADEVKPQEQKVEEVNKKNKQIEKVDLHKIIEESKRGKIKETSPVQERPVTYCADGDTLGRLKKSGISIEGNKVLLDKERSAGPSFFVLHLVEKNGVYTESVIFESSEIDKKIIIKMRVLNSDQTEEELIIVDGVLVGFEREIGPDENKKN